LHDYTLYYGWSEDIHGMHYYENIISKLWINPTQSVQETIAICHILDAQQQQASTGSIASQQHAKQALACLAALLQPTGGMIALIQVRQ